MKEKEEPNRIEQIVKVSSNYLSPLIYIPKKIQRVLNLSRGDYVRLICEDGKVLVIPLKFEEGDS
jgi:AbrB family looped-hinge helix DNA binding protein